MVNGFLISTSMNKELKAFKEFSTKMDSFIQADQKQLDNFSNFTESLAQELRNLKIHENFTVIEQYKSLLIVKNLTKSLPSELFNLLRVNDCVFHSIKRILPLELITKYDETVIASFIQRNKFVGSFKIQFEGRLCSPELKSNLFKIIIPLLENKVNLDTPDYVILIQAFKGLIGLSVMKNDDKNFNFSFYIEENNDKQREISVSKNDESA